MTTLRSTIPAHWRPGGGLHPTETGVAPVDLPPPNSNQPAPDNPYMQADTHVQINGELASRLMRSSRWQQ